MVIRKGMPGYGVRWKASGRDCGSRSLIIVWTAFCSAVVVDVVPGPNVPRPSLTVCSLFTVSASREQQAISQPAKSWKWKVSLASK